MGVIVVGLRFANRAESLKGALCCDSDNRESCIALQ